MSGEKELAYRYDLFVTPDWSDRFDSLIDENVTMPSEGSILEVNSGTGSHAIELAEKMGGKGLVIGLDPSRERTELARAKAQVKKVKDVTFEQYDGSSLPFERDRYDAVIGDASLLEASNIEPLLTEMVRVTRPGGRVVLKLSTHGSFDELFSILWETLFKSGLVEESWNGLEKLVNERGTISEAEAMAERAGLSGVESFSNKEEFLFATGQEFLDAPLIRDLFLPCWLAIVPESSREQVSREIVSLIEDERHGASFSASIKATVISGTKVS